MIELYEGRLGGGKSYSAVVRMVDQLRRGGIICTNVEIIWEAIVEYVRKRWGLILENDQCIKLTDDQIGMFHRYTPTGTADLPVLVVVDEAHLNFNARDHAQTDRRFRETLTFLTQSRKVHTDIIFISQSILNMDKQFMRLVQFIWRFRDLQRWKIPGLGIPYPLKQILCVQYDYDGRTMLNRQFIKKDPAIFALYNTNSLLRPFPRLEDVVTKRNLQKVEKKSMAKFLIPLGIIVGIIAAYYIVKNFGKDMGATPAAASSSRPAAVATASSNPLVPRSEKEKGQYDIYAEQFQAWNGPDKALKTQESGWYQVGEMSSRGFVTAVSERRAKIVQPDGRPGWIVAVRDAKIPGGVVGMTKPSPSPSPSPSAGSAIIIAPDPTRSTPPPEIIPVITATPFPVIKVR